MTTDDLRALAGRIRDAVAQRLPRGLRQVDVVCEARGIRTRETIAGVGEHAARVAVDLAGAVLGSMTATRVAGER